MSSPQPPMDYITRVALAAVETLVAKHALRPNDAQTLLAAIGAEQSRVAKHEATTPDEDIARRVAVLKAADPTLPPAQAQEQAIHADPALWERRRQVQLFGRVPSPPVEKEAPLTYEQVLKMADDRRVGHPEMTRRQVLVEMVQEHPQRYAAAYRRYHLTDGRQEHEAAVLAKSQTR